MNKKDEIYEYCKNAKCKLTAMDIINALYPDKQQPYINSKINELVAEKKLVREDTGRVYTVHVPFDGEDIPEPKDYTRGPNKNKAIRGNQAKLIPAPCKNEVEKYLREWDALDNYTLQEKALNKLFLETYTINTAIEDVLIKVAALNDFYSTNIFSIYPVAKHIVDMNIDSRLKAGDLTLVNEIAKVASAEGKEHHFYSFATKYCSHHQPEKYAIFDSYVEKMLKYFRGVDRFYDFKDTDLKEYECFFETIQQFKKYYGLNMYSLKELDRYLWLLGKKWFPRKDR